MQNGKRRPPMADDSRSPLPDHDPSEEPVFLLENLLEGARRQKGLAEAPIPVIRGASWTTDAPFRETERLIASLRRGGIVSVEMEAAALLALGTALDKPVICLAHVTNAMATRGEDFERGGTPG